MIRRSVINYRAVLFDCDDTILETAKSRWSVMISTAEGFSCHIDEADIGSVWGRPFRDMITALLPAVDFDEYLAAYRQAMREVLPTVAPGARELLAHLRDHGVEMRILTSSSRDLIQQDLEALDLEKFFDRIYGYEQTVYHKPDARALAVPIGDFAQRGISVADIMYIGDAVRDYQAADGCGVAFVAVTSGMDTAEDLIAAGVDSDAVVARLDELVSA